MTDVTYTSRVQLVRIAGAIREATLPAEPVPIRFGTHGPIAAHYGVKGQVAEPHATTLDYVVAAAGG